MPIDAVVLTVERLQDGSLCLFALGNPKFAKEPRKITCYATGSGRDELPGRYIGTVRFEVGELHFFDKKAAPVLE